MTPSLRRRTYSERETETLAREVAGSLGGGSVVLLHGELGAGKTAFVRGVVEGVGGDPTAVSSPTFTLVQPYAARLTVQHVDLYRLRGEEVADLGLDELRAPDAIVVIEWADRLPSVPPDAVEVHMTDCGDDEREIEIRGLPGAQPPSNYDNSGLPS